MAATPKSHLHVLILCGGGGTRLWPLSTKKVPKQFVRLLTSTTSFEDTFHRATSLTSPENVWVITTKNYVDLVHQQAAEMPTENIIAEPMPKNTAMAHLVGALFITQRDPEAVIINLHADHWVPQTEPFVQAVLAAAKHADQHEHLLSVGVKPTFPSTGLGYIKQGKIIDNQNGFPIYKIERFVEKPDLENAQKFLNEGSFVWNTGYYTWGGKVLLATAGKTCPEVMASVGKIRDDWGNPSFDQTFLEAYERAPTIPTDVAVSERADNMAVVPGNFTWTDIGDFKALYGLGGKDDQGNVTKEDNGKILTLDAKNNIVWAEEGLVTVIGVENLAVIKSKNRVVVCSLDRTQVVKELVDLLMSDPETQKYYEKS